MKLLMLSVVFLPVFLFSQNSIIIFRTTNMLTVGTDSYRAVQARQGVKQNKDTPDTLQNIIQEGNFYFAITGVASKTTIQAARQSCREGKTISSILARFKEIRTKSLADEMFDMKIYQTTLYNRSVANRYLF